MLRVLRFEETQQVDGEPESMKPFNPFLLIQRSPINRRRSTPRRGPLRDPNYRAYVRTFPCYVCSLLGMRQKSRTEAAHTQNNGMSSKGPDSSCAPLCRKLHHPEYDDGRLRFERKYGVNMRGVASDCWQGYLREAA